MKEIDLPPSLYEAAGASASKEELHATLNRIGLEGNSLFFAQLLPDLAGDPNFYSFIHCDGAGTKTIIPYLMWREGADAAVFSGLAQDALVMNLDDILCCGVPDRMVISNLVLRNAALIGSEPLEAIIRGYSELCSELQRHGVQIELGGGETADCGDTIRTLSVDAVIAGRIKRELAIRTDRIAPGDEIIALASSGKSSYESVENSGIGSNGISLARHSLLSNAYAKKYPEILSPQSDPQIAYRGPFQLSDHPPELHMSVGDALRSPTRTFAPLLLQLYREHFSAIHGVIHLTGGGLTKVLRFGQGNHYIKDALLPTPGIFQLIQRHGGVSPREMFQVFNMGQRIELYVKPGSTTSILQRCAEYRINAQVIGHVEASTRGRENELTIRDTGAEYRYSINHAGASA